MKLNTLLNHPPEIEIVAGNKPLLSPVYHSAKFTVNDELPYGDQFLYGRISNPTLKQLEETLRLIQGKADCIVVSSGIGALTGTFLGLLKSGDHMITFRELYKPARMFIRDFLPRYGIQSTVLSLNSLNDLEGSIRPETKLIQNKAYSF
jgi:cystathionine beta-lyase/cystathionine gamma-synthase